jgi:hypothetical protein
MTGLGSRPLDERYDVRGELAPWDRQLTRFDGLDQAACELAMQGQEVLPVGVGSVHDPGWLTQHPFGEVELHAPQSAQHSRSLRLPVAGEAFDKNDHQRLTVAGNTEGALLRCESQSFTPHHPAPHSTAKSIS